MDDQRQGNQLEPIYNSSLPIRDVALKTFPEKWTIKADNGRESWVSMQAARYYYYYYYYYYYLDI